MILLLPEEIQRKIYSYIFDSTLCELKKLKSRYTYDDNDDFKNYYENRLIINGSYHFTIHCIHFPTIVSAYLFDIGIKEICDFEN